MNKLFLTLIVISITLVLSGCADVEIIEKCVHGHTYGFWGGLWHGLILPFSFFGQLFSDDIAMYAVNNNGGWYNFGFWVGACVIGVGTGSSTSSRK